MTEFLMIMGIFALMIIGIAIGCCNILASQDQDEFFEKFLVIEGIIFIVGFFLLGIVGILRIFELI